jgi:hypothetical protein
MKSLKVSTFKYRESLINDMPLNSIKFSRDIRPNQTGVRHPRWKGGKSRMYILRKATQSLINANRDVSKCERCMSTKRLLIHHKDGNNQNNISNNLEVLCYRCHLRHHKSKELEKICENCGTKFITIPSKKDKRKYCSRSCYAVTKSKSLKGKYPENLIQFKDRKLKRDELGRFKYYDKDRGE